MDPTRAHPGLAATCRPSCVAICVLDVTTSVGLWRATLANLHQSVAIALGLKAALPRPWECVGRRGRSRCGSSRLLGQTAE